MNSTEFAQTVQCWECLAQIRTCAAPSLPLCCCCWRAGAGPAQPVLEEEEEEEVEEEKEEEEEPGWCFKGLGLASSSYQTTTKALRASFFTPACSCSCLSSNFHKNYNKFAEALSRCMEMDIDVCTCCPLIYLWVCLGWRESQNWAWCFAIDYLWCFAIDYLPQSDFSSSTPIKL